jgi:hypothetical protein
MGFVAQSHLGISTPIAWPSASCFVAYLRPTAESVLSRCTLGRFL